MVGKELTDGEILVQEDIPVLELMIFKKSCLGEVNKKGGGLIGQSNQQ